MRYLIVIMVVLIMLAGCAPYGPWPFSTEEQRRERLLYPGMSVSDVTAMKGRPIAHPNYNPRAAGYRIAELPEKFTGIAYFGIQGSGCCERVLFANGFIQSVGYVRNPWAGYDTWQLHELTWDKQ